MICPHCKKEFSLKNEQDIFEQKNLIGKRVIITQTASPYYNRRGVVEECSGLYCKIKNQSGSYSYCQRGWFEVID